MSTAQRNAMLNVIERQTTRHDEGNLYGCLNMTGAWTQGHREGYGDGMTRAIRILETAPDDADRKDIIKTLVAQLPMTGA